MATRSSRRGLGARIILGAALLGLVAASLPAQAVIIPQLVGSSVGSGYAALTVDQFGKLERGCGYAEGTNQSGVPHCYTTADPPYAWTDAQSKFIMSRWGVTLCGAGFSNATVTGALGAIPGTVSFHNYNGNPDRVIKFTPDPVARPNGFTSADVPISVTWTAVALEPGPVCGGTTTITQEFVLDRKLPTVPTIASPAPLAGCPGAATTSPPTNWERTCPVAPQSGNVVVRGTASDPVTRPWEDQEPEKYWETSGIKAVVLRLSSCAQRFNCGARATNTFLKSYTLEFPCGDISPVTATIQRCAAVQPYSFTIPSADMLPGVSYAVDVYALDVNGYRSPVASNRSVNSDNMSGYETNPHWFVYLGPLS